MNCRFCGAVLQLPFVDLGSAPPSNAYLTSANLHAPEMWFPLRVLVCERCWLVQTEDFSQTSVLFPPDYAYFSSFSDTWLEHAKQYVQSMTLRYSLGSQSKVVEVAANDGYLLQFVKKAGIPCLGIEPTSDTARAARDKGIQIIEEFFGERLARILVADGHAADLVVANNVIAHVPDIKNFVGGFPILLKPQGVATFEFPYLLELVQENQFDTIYHEHYSYLSLTTVESIFSDKGLYIFEVEKLPTHGGSLRVYAQRANQEKRERSDYVEELLSEEMAAGIKEPAFYANLQGKANQVKNNLLAFLLEAKKNEMSVAAYGAAAKGNTLLNFAGVRPDLLDYVADRNPAKQGKFMPGSRIPIMDEAHLKHNRPDYVLILPWNLLDEIIEQLKYIRQWGGKFVTAIPKIRIIP